MSNYAETADTVASLPELMAQVRAKRGLSLRAAAEEVGLPFTTFHHIEQCIASPSADKVIAILNWLDGQPDYVFAEA